MKKSEFTQLNLPQAPGVYFFRDAENNILYIGRATSLKDRVSSYFSPDLISTRGPLLVDMVTKSHTITYLQTDSVLEAIITESREIKKWLPYYNTKEKDNRSYNFVVITDEDFPRIVIVRGRELDKLNEEGLKFKVKYQFGPFPQGNLLKDALKILRKIFPFRDAKARIPHQNSFYQSLGLAPKTDTPEDQKKYALTIRNLVLFFEGKKQELITALERDMKMYAENQEFEEAQRVRNTLYALSHIQDVSLIKEDTPHGREGFRIEAYDIAHMAGKSTVGVMTVVTGGEPEKNQYKKFKISKDVNDDVGALKEVLTRRFSHPEWKLPDLIVIDGGISQKNAAESIVKDIPLVTVVKNDAHKPDHFLGDEVMIRDHGSSILLANYEAHRFAIAYHKKLRNRKFFGV